MASSVLSTALAATETTEHELPVPPEVFGAAALVVLVLLLVATFAFRGVANRH